MTKAKATRQVHATGYELKDLTNTGKRQVKVYQNFQDKKTKENISTTYTYQLAPGVNPDTFTARADQQNQDFLNMNIKEFLIPAGILKDTGNKALIEEMMKQANS